MTNAELIAACQQVANLTESIDRYAFTLATSYGDDWLKGDLKGNAASIQKWHDNRVLERSEILATIRKKIAYAAALPTLAAPEALDTMPDSFTITLNYWQIAALVAACYIAARNWDDDDKATDIRRIGSMIQEQRKAQWKDAPSVFKP